jgi:hypothetical protein
MTERDELWVPETWEKEDEGKMCKRLDRGLGEVMDMSRACTCTSFLVPRSFSSSLFSSSHFFFPPLSLDTPSLALDGPRGVRRGNADE